MLQVKEAVQSKAKSNATAVAVSKHRSSDGSNVQASVDPVEDILTGIEKGLGDEFKKLKASESWQAIMKAAKTAETESKRLFEEGVAAIEKEIEQIEGEIDKCELKGECEDSLTHHFFSLYEDADPLRKAAAFLSLMTAVSKFNKANFESEKNNFITVLELTSGLSDNFQFTVQIVDEALKLCDKISEEVVKLAGNETGNDWKEKFENTLKDMHAKADEMRDFYQEAILALESAGVEVKEFLKKIEEGEWFLAAVKFGDFQLAVDKIGKMWADEVKELTDKVKPLVVELQTNTEKIHVQALEVSPEEPEEESASSGSFR